MRLTVKLCHNLVVSNKCDSTAEPSRPLQAYRLLVPPAVCKTQLVELKRSLMVATRDHSNFLSMTYMFVGRCLVNTSHPHLPPAFKSIPTLVHTMIHLSHLHAPAGIDMALTHAPAASGAYYEALQQPPHRSAHQAPSSWPSSYGQQQYAEPQYAQQRYSQQAYQQTPYGSSDSYPTSTYTAQQQQPSYPSYTPSQPFTSSKLSPEEPYDYPSQYHPSQQQPQQPQQGSWSYYEHARPSQQQSQLSQSYAQPASYYSRQDMRAAPSQLRPTQTTYPGSSYPTSSSQHYYSYQYSAPSYPASSQYPASADQYAACQQPSTATGSYQTSSHQPPSYKASYYQPSSYERAAVYQHSITTEPARMPDSSSYQQMPAIATGSSYQRTITTSSDGHAVKTPPQQPNYQLSFQHSHDSSHQQAQAADDEGLDLSGLHMLADVAIMASKSKAGRPARRQAPKRAQHHQQSSSGADDEVVILGEVRADPSNVKYGQLLQAMAAGVSKSRKY